MYIIIIIIIIIMIMIIIVLASSVKLLVVRADVLHLVPKVFLRNGKHTVSSHQVMAVHRRLL